MWAFKAIRNTTVVTTLFLLCAIVPQYAAALNLLGDAVTFQKDMGKALLVSTLPPRPRFLNVIQQVMGPAIAIYLWWYVLTYKCEDAED